MFRFQQIRFQNKSFDIGFGTFSLQKKSRFRLKFWSRQTVPLWGVFIGLDHCLALSVSQYCFEDLIGLTLVDEDA